VRLKVAIHVPFDTPTISEGGAAVEEFLAVEVVLGLPWLGVTLGYQITNFKYYNYFSLMRIL